MASSYQHAQSSAKKHGGSVDDYLFIHNWFDETKIVCGDNRHRALRHHTFGIFEAEKRFGNTVVLENGKRIPIRVIGEQHVREDCLFIPTPMDYLSKMVMQKFMNTSKRDQELAMEDTQFPGYNDYKKQGSYPWDLHKSDETKRRSSDT